MEKFAVFDVFRIEGDGSERWVDSAESFSAALFQAELAAIQLPGKYAITNQNNGERQVINLGTDATGDPKNVGMKKGLRLSTGNLIRGNRVKT